MDRSARQRGVATNRYTEQAYRTDPSDGPAWQELVGPTAPQPRVDRRSAGPQDRRTPSRPRPRRRIRYLVVMLVVAVIAIASAAVALTHRQAMGATGMVAVPADESTYVAEDHPGSSFGGAATIRASSRRSAEAIAYVKFVVPDHHGTHVTSAELVFTTAAVALGRWRFMASQATSGGRRACRSGSGRRCTVRWPARRVRSRPVPPLASISPISSPPPAPTPSP